MLIRKVHINLHAQESAFCCARCADMHKKVRFDVHVV